MQKSASLGNLPRVVTLLSQDRQNFGSRLQPKREVKISVIERAIVPLLTVEQANKKERESAMNESTVFGKQDSGRLYSIFAF